MMLTRQHEDNHNFHRDLKGDGDFADKGAWVHCQGFDNILVILYFPHIVYHIFLPHRVHISYFVVCFSYYSALILFVFHVKIITTIIITTITITIITIIIIWFRLRSWVWKRRSCSILKSFSPWQTKWTNRKRWDDLIDDHDYVNSAAVAAEGGIEGEGGDDDDCDLWSRWRWRRRWRRWRRWSPCWRKPRKRFSIIY